MKNYWLTGITVLYLLACFLPEVKEVSPQGFWYLIYPLAWLLPAWWANPIFFAGWVALARGNGGLACLLGVVATAFATTFFAAVFRMKGPGAVAAAFSVPGIDCWLLSMVALATAGFVIRDNKTRLAKMDRSDDLRAVREDRPKDTYAVRKALLGGNWCRFSFIDEENGTAQKIEANSLPKCVFVNFHLFGCRQNGSTKADTNCPWQPLPQAVATDPAALALVPDPNGVFQFSSREALTVSQAWQRARRK